VGLARSIREFGRALQGQRVQFEMDCEPAVLILRKCFSPNPDCMEAVLSIVDLCCLFHITPKWEHILAPFNQVADALSHNDLTQAEALCKAEFGGSLVLQR
jgi:hypothetical protein